MVFLINPDEKRLVMIMPDGRTNMVLRVKYVCFNTWKFPLPLSLIASSHLPHLLASPNFFNIVPEQVLHNNVTLTE